MELISSNPPYILNQKHMSDEQDVNDVLITPAVPGEPIEESTPETDDKAKENVGEEGTVQPATVVEPEAQGDGGSDNTPKPSADEPVKPDNSKPDTPTEAEVKSYNSLRVKLQEQGVEKNLLKEEVDTLKAKVNEANEELDAYKEWYNKYYPVLNNLMQDDNIKEKVQSNLKPKTLTIDEANKLFEKKLSERDEFTQYKKETDNWFEKHPDVKGDVATKMSDIIKKQKLTPSVETLDMVYSYLVKTSPEQPSNDDKDELAKKIQEEKLKNASIAGGANNIPTKNTNKVDDLFSVPASRYYPNA